MKARAIVVVCDGLGVGPAPDADAFGDAGKKTLQHVLRDGRPAIPNLTHLGLLHTLYEDAPASLPAPSGAFGRLAEVSAGKDTVTGHWELMELPVDAPFPLYPDGFPPDLVSRFEAAIGRRVLGNKAASGTVILDELGEEHVATGRPILYTSGDSVFQIAAHEDVIPIEKLYEWCAIARALLVPPHQVGRVIARPFVGPGKGRFTRTHWRKDFSVAPPSPTLLDRAKAAGRSVHALGKIEDIFAGRGISSAIHTESNRDGIERTIAALVARDDDLVFTNLVDFDTKYGHRNDPRGYARCLEELDVFLPALLGALREDDVLLFTADHGGDPSDVSTDHTREFVPVVAAGPGVRGGVDIGTRRTFADLGATVAEHLGLAPARGESFLHAILPSSR
ncbi:MAG TPA: phosphopentomutase [Thermoanaerobaculia bacterium]|nr:phosphopentomutase [Thermoanaerobaculia bacterium]